jgi:transposase
LLDVEGAVVEQTYYEEGLGLIVRVRPKRGQQDRCPHCERRSPAYDWGEGLRRWRALDLGTTKAFVEANAPRVRCPEHGVSVASVPWARHGSWFTRAFENQVGWLVTHTNRTAVSRLMRLSWRAVTRIVERVVLEARSKVDLLDGLRRIGIDEVSYKKGHRYLTVVVDHDRDRLVWAVPGRDNKAIRSFFEALGPQRAAHLELVSTDAAGWILPVVRQMAPQAQLCTDPFHVVTWATRALDAVRRNLWNELRRSGEPQLALALKRCRYALWKAPENLTERQQQKLATIKKVNEPLYRAYLLKEQLREVFRAKGRTGMDLLDRWLAWAARCRLQPFVELGRQIRRHLPEIRAALRHGLSNARVESANTRMRLLHRMAFGFHRPRTLIALAHLKLSGLCPPLPGRP